MNVVDLRVYLVTDTAMCGGRGVRDTVRRAVAGGATVVQLRDHDATTRELCALGSALHDELGRTGVPLVIDDRVDVALAVGADGVHLGQSDMDPHTARKLCGPSMVIGHSVSNVVQAKQASSAPIDYVGVGPYRATATKPDASDPLGADGVREVIAAGGMPAVVIGGIGEADLPVLRAAGASGVAVVSAICAAHDPEAAASRLRSTWDGLA